MPKRKRGTKETLPKDEPAKGGVKRERSIVRPHDGEVWSKSKKKRMRKLKARSQHRGTAASSTQQETKKKRNQKKDEEPLKSDIQVGGKQSALQQSFLARLSGARFRELNEVCFQSSLGVEALYSQSSATV